MTYLRRYNETFIDLVLQFYGASIFLDSSKDPVRIRYLAGIPTLQLYVVHLVRDGRGVVNSARKNQHMGILEAATEWRDTHLEIERVTRRFCNGRTLRIKYEDLCATTDSVLASVLALITTPDTIRTREPAERAMHVLGNRMRLKSARPISADESWKRELSTADLAAFASIAGTLNQRYGYGVAGGLA